MKTRVIVGLVAGAAVLVPIYLGGGWFVGLILAVALVGSHEMYHLLDLGGFKPITWLGILWAVAITAAFWQPALLPLSLVLTVGSIVTIVHCLFRPDQPVYTWMSTTLGAAYLGVALGSALALRLLPAGLWLFLFGILLVWANDVSAYFVGVLWGRRRIWPRLSPKKTWEGTISGWAAAGIAGGLLAWAMPIAITPAVGVLTGLLCGVLAFFGDLSISMLKRQVGAKDSGAVFPGHGGMLDRIDSLLFVLPIVYQVALLYR